MEEALYDGEGQRVQQIDASNTSHTTTQHTYVGGTEDLASQWPNAGGSVTTTTTAYYAGGLAQSVNGTLSYSLADGLGSVSESVNASGTVSASQLYGPYGSVRYQNGTLPTDYAFTHQRSDATSGLDYYGARYYDPVAGQFSSADTVQDGLNRYGYVGGNPTTATDPSGHCIEDLCIGEGILLYVGIVVTYAAIVVAIHNLSNYLQTHPISMSGAFGPGGTTGDSSAGAVSGTAATSGVSNAEMTAELTERERFHGYRFPVNPPTSVPVAGPASGSSGAGGIQSSNPPSTYPSSGTPASVGAGGWAPAPTDPGGTWSVITQTLGGAAAVGASYNAATKYYDGQRINVRPLTDKEVRKRGFHRLKGREYEATDVIYEGLDGNGKPTGEYWIGEDGGDNVTPFP